MTRLLSDRKCDDAAAPCDDAEEEEEEKKRLRADLRQSPICRCLRATPHLLCVLPWCLAAGFLMYSVMLLRVALAVCGLCTGRAALRRAAAGGAGPSIFFDGGGWGFAFSLGVVQHIQRHYDAHDQCRVFAISAGNFAALCLLLQWDPADVLRNHFAATRRAMLRRPLCGFCDDLGPIRAFLEGLLPDDVHVRTRGRYHVIVSSWPCLGFRVLRDFASKEELIEAVLCSCSLLGFVWRPRYVPPGYGWCGCWIDAAYQNIISPVDDVVDIAVRPYPKNRPHSLVPSPGAYHPRNQIMTYELAVKQMAVAATDAARYEKLASVLQPYAKGVV